MRSRCSWVGAVGIGGSPESHAASACRGCVDPSTRASCSRDRRRIRRALIFVGVLACSRPHTSASQPSSRAAPEPAVAVDAGRCVEPDRDGDGVVDECDACPDESGRGPTAAPTSSSSSLPRFAS